MARSVTPLIAGLRPGSLPPPVRMPMTPFFVLILAINCRFAPLGDVETEIISLGGDFRKRMYSSSRLVTLCLSPLEFPAGDEFQWREVGCRLVPADAVVARVR